MSEEIIPLETIASRIVVLRGQKVMLDRDLALLYGVATRALNQAVKRNAERFPDDFMFQLSGDEADALSRSEFVTLKPELPSASSLVSRNIKSSGKRAALRFTAWLNTLVGTP